VLAGILCMISRVVTSWLPWHVWFGRIYILFMFYTMSASLLIHNVGLPLPIIVFFGFLLVGMSAGWIAIKFHSQKMDSLAKHNVENIIKSGAKWDNLEKMINEQKKKVCFFYNILVFL